ncbi:hypothetical protein CMV00_07580 [Elizabethkingia anophelis]|nr:hypothetical protein [Elizabethkingia anophelis]
MKNLHYPFELGEQYEKWEFDLVIVDEDRIKGCDCYFYLGTLSLFGEKAEHVEMIFSMDILTAVFIKFSPTIFRYLIKYNEIIENYQFDDTNNILFYKR